MFWQEVADGIGTEVFRPYEFQKYKKPDSSGIASTEASLLTSLFPE